MARAAGLAPPPGDRPASRGGRGPAPANRAFDGLAGPRPGGTWTGRNRSSRGTWPAWTSSPLGTVPSASRTDQPSPACRSCVPGPQRPSPRRSIAKWRRTRRVGQAGPTRSRRRSGHACSGDHRGRDRTGLARESNWPRREPPWPCSKRGRGPRKSTPERATTGARLDEELHFQEGIWARLAVASPVSGLVVTPAEGEDRPVLPGGDLIGEVESVTGLRPRSSWPSTMRMSPDRTARRPEDSRPPHSGPFRSRVDRICPCRSPRRGAQSTSPPTADWRR